MNRHAAVHLLVHDTGADFTADDTVTAHDSLGTIHFQMSRDGVTVYDGRAASQITHCQTLTQLRAALDPVPGSGAHHHTGTLITSLGRLTYEFSVIRNLQQEELDVRVLLDRLNPIRYAGQAYDTLRLFAYAHAQPRATSCRSGHWSDPPPTLRTQGHQVATRAWAALWSPPVNTATRLADARYHLARARTDLDTARTARITAEHQWQTFLTNAAPLPLLA